MTKRNTIEVDDEEDLIDEHLVNEELEIFERESLVSFEKFHSNLHTSLAKNRLKYCPYWTFRF